MKLSKTALMEAWISSEFDARGLALQRAIQVEYEYHGPQFGATAVFAYVRFHCEPADELTFEVDAWPPTDVEEDEWEQFCEGMGVALIDGLMCAPQVHHSRVRVVLRQARCDGMMSNRKAFYRAARGAMQALVDNGSWAWDLPPTA